MSTVVPEGAFKDRVSPADRGPTQKLSHSCADLRQNSDTALVQDKLLYCNTLHVIGESRDWGRNPLGLVLGTDAYRSACSRHGPLRGIRPDLRGWDLVCPAPGGAALGDRHRRSLRSMGTKTAGRRRGSQAHPRHERPEASRLGRYRSNPLLTSPCGSPDPAELSCCRSMCST